MTINGTAFTRRHLAEVQHDERHDVGRRLEHQDARARAVGRNHRPYLGDDTRRNRGECDELHSWWNSAAATSASAASAAASSAAASARGIHDHELQPDDRQPGDTS